MQKKKKSENEEKANSFLLFFLPFCHSLLPVNIREAMMGLREKKNKKIKLQGLNIGKNMLVVMKMHTKTKDKKLRQKWRRAEG